MDEDSYGKDNRKRERRGFTGAVNRPQSSIVRRSSRPVPSSSSTNSHSQTNLPHIGYKMLCDMLAKEPDEMIVDMTRDYFQLDKYLVDDRLKTNFEWIEKLTILFERMLDCLGQEKRIADILIKLPDSLYFKVLHEEIRRTDPKTGTLRFGLIHQILKILDRLLTISPHAESSVSPFLDRIETCLNRINIENDEIKQLHKKIAEKSEVIYHQKEEEKQIQQKKPVIDLRPPPNDFHLLKLIPSMSEILSNEPIYLRANIVEQGGSYENADHYLDIHFRLLREDFLGPLRDGIQMYLSNSSSKNMDIRIYENVFTLGPKLNSKCGLVYGLQLDKAKFGRIQWANSRRLIYGSLLALTSNRFQTCLFVTVEDRTNLEKDLKFYVRPYLETNDLFVNQDLTKLDLLTCQQSLTMVETTSYFEAYRHVLNALQKISSDKFPLDSYILHLSSDITPPTYVTAKTQFDFTPLFIPMKARIKSITKLHVQSNSTELNNQQPSFAINYESNSSMNRQYRKVTLLNDQTWPKSNEIQLNEKQHEALKLALTKKVALIQGPPGTGKTFLGVKIAELLLHNRSVWCSTTEENSPILMVCQTNHALDQFLEHIITRLQMTDGLIRVGGRCKNETILPFSLTKARQNYREKHWIPAVIHKQKRDIMNRKLLSQSAIQSNEKTIDASYLYLTPLSSLEEKKVIKFEHYNSLIGGSGYYHSLGRVLTEWLGLNEKVDIVDSINDELDEMTIEENQLRDDEENDEEDRRRDEIDDDEEFFQPSKIVPKIKFISHENQPDDSEWQTVVNKNKQKHVIHQLLALPTKLTDNDVEKFQSNLWRLSMTQRHDLYRYWLKIY